MTPAGILEQSLLFSWEWSVSFSCLFRNNSSGGHDDGRLTRTSNQDFPARTLLSATSCKALFEGCRCCFFKLSGFVTVSLSQVVPWKKKLQKNIKLSRITSLLGKTVAYRGPGIYYVCTYHMYLDRSRRTSSKCLTSIVLSPATTRGSTNYKTSSSGARYPELRSHVGVTCVSSFPRALR